MMLTEAIICLATAVYFEARGEPLVGQVAVAKVVMNRVKDERHPKTVCDVVRFRVKATCAFSFMCDKEKLVVNDMNAWRSSVNIASLVFNGKLTDPTNGATHFHAKTMQPKWSNVQVTAKIGNHIFYRSEQ
jgi:spore germination cell wall hydrolase CwlJ-like protein